MSSKLSDKKDADNSAGIVPKNDGEHTISIIPGEQRRITLGEYTHRNAPKGFEIDFNPEPKPLGSVETQVIHIGSAKKYKMVLFIANFSSQPVTVTVRQL